MSIGLQVLAIRLLRSFPSVVFTDIPWLCCSSGWKGNMLNINASRCINDLLKDCHYLLVAGGNVLTYNGTAR